MESLRGFDKDRSPSLSPMRAGIAFDRVQRVLLREDLDERRYFPRLINEVECRSVGHGDGVRAKVAGADYVD